jgi:hypothetical protein
MISINGKIYLVDKHYPWTLQKSYEWNYKRAFMYIRIMSSLKRDTFDPYDVVNIEIINKLNLILHDS